MKTLGENWITERTLDFEYKKYILLAYLQEVDKEFGSTKLYPALSELFAHYRNAVSFKESKRNMEDNFPQRLSTIDLERFKLKYEKVLEDEAVMKEIETILDFSIPKFEHYVAEGKKIYDMIEEQLNIYPVGVIPLNPNEGYFFLRNGSLKETRVYEYQIRLFEQPGERYRGIHTQFLRSYVRNYVNTFESIKTELIHDKKEMPNPATYAIETEMVLPVEETLLPIAKRILVKYVSGG
ncbi:MAG TPA: hypothetical protein VI112_02925 [Bacteroidia bacterium]|jgi:hypothetical protein